MQVSIKVQLYKCNKVDVPTTINQTKEIGNIERWDK